MNTEILNDIGTMNAVVIKNRASTITAHGDPGSGGKSRGLLVERGRILIATDYDFATEADAEAHMKAVVAACVEWGNAGMPRLG
jgi:hypothetical protein